MRSLRSSEASSSLRRLLHTIFIASGVLLASCGSQGSEGVAPPTELPVLVAMPAAPITMGLASGRMRESANVAAYKITQHPITGSDFNECVAAGACTVVRDEACSETLLQTFGTGAFEDAKSPAVCVGAAQATAFCGWIGGRLPKLSEWLFAARGKEPVRYPWGDKAPSCDQHPGALKPIEEGSTRAAIDSGEPCRLPDDDEPVKIGTSPGPLGENGAQDFLLASAELVAADDASLWNACLPAVVSTCLVHGQGGAIESVRGFTPPINGEATNSSEATHPSGPSDQPSAVPYAFRCVVED